MFFDLTLVAQFLHLGLNAGMSKLPPPPFPPLFILILRLPNIITSNTK